MEDKGFSNWCIVEIKGFVKIAGLITDEQSFGGGNIARIDIPLNADVGDSEYITQYFGWSSVHRLHPTDEAIARQVAIQNRPQPVNSYQLQNLLPDTIDDF